MLNLQQIPWLQEYHQYQGYPVQTEKKKQSIKL